MEVHNTRKMFAAVLCIVELSPPATHPQVELLQQSRQASRSPGNDGPGSGIPGCLSPLIIVEREELLPSKGIVEPP